METKRRTQCRRRPARLKACYFFGSSLAMWAMSARARSILGARGSSCLPVVVEQDQLIVVGAERVLGEIGGEQRHVLAPALCLGIGVQVLRLGGEADAERRFPARRDGAEDIGIGLQFQRHLARALFQLVPLRVLGPVIGDRGDADEHVRPRHARHYRVIHLLRTGNVYALHAPRRRQRGGAAHQRDRSARVARRARHRITHFSGARIGDPAHGVYRLESRPGRYQHALARQQSGLEKRLDVLEYFFRLEHAPHADFAAGLVAARGSEDGNAVRT